MHDDPAPRCRRLVRPEDVELRPLAPADDAFLYALLVERYERPDTNILGLAQEELPTFAEHVAYLRGEPYRRAEIIVVDGADVGLMFLNRRGAAGCFVARAMLGRGAGLAACYRFLVDCEPPVFAHLNPRNRPARRTVERLGFALVDERPDRLTFELTGPPRDPFVRVADR